MKVVVLDKDVQSKIAVYAESALPVIIKAIRLAGQILVDEERKNLVDDNHVVTGKLYRDIGVYITSRSKGQVEARIGTLRTKYGPALEYGQDPGTQADINKLKEWVKLKYGLNDSEEVNKRALRIQKIIFRKGTKPHPWVQPAIDAKFDIFVNKLNSEISRGLTQ
jgi:hypothetical protein